MPVRLRTPVALVAVLAGAASAATADARPTIHARRMVATAVPFDVRGAGAGRRGRVAIQRRLNRRWRGVATVTADVRGRFRARLAPRRLARRYRLRARVAGSGAVSRTIVVRSRPVTLDAVGDINLGDGVASVLARRGLTWPWRNVGPVLRGADIAFGNLECAVSRRGSPIAKQYRFRGSPAALRAARRTAGLDVLNLANNHTGDFGRAALGDTIRNVRRDGMAPVGAGASLAGARRAHVVTRLGLRIAFIGFSDILPLSFAAGPHRSGTAFASVSAIRSGVRAARRRADLVIVTFHWGTERVTHENSRQRTFARAALRAGATAVLGAHPHVLQPIRRIGRHHLIAYSLGNFVFSAGGGATSRTGILQLELSGRGVEGVRFRRARIVGARPRL